MFSNMVDLAETDFVRNASYPRNTQGFEKNISFATTSCLPEIGVSRFNHLLETAPTFYHIPSSLKGPHLSIDSSTTDDACCWAEIEFCRAPLGDIRRVKRLIQLAQERGAAPNASIPQSCGSHAATKAAYRFYDNLAIFPKAILASHQQATVERMSSKALVLAVQDTTELDYTAHPATEGLGTLHETKHHGLLVHTTLAVTEQRVPLGIIQQQVWSRPEAEFGKKQSRKQRPMQEKESYKWLKSLQVTSPLQQQFDNTRVVNVGDREADVYELFDDVCVGLVHEDNESHYHLGLVQGTQSGSETVVARYPGTCFMEQVC